MSAQRRSVTYSIRTDTDFARLVANERSMAGAVGQRTGRRQRTRTALRCRTPVVCSLERRARMLRVAAKRRAIEPTSGAAAATSTLAEFASTARSRQICPAGKHLWTKRWNGVSRRGSSSPAAGGIRITRCTAMRRLAHARDEIHRTAVGSPYRGRRNPVLPITTLRTRLVRLGWNQTTGGRTQLAPA